MTAPRTRKKLIEVSIPLEAINKASAREKSIRHGHPSTLHLWWARRPLAACRAVLFAQLVDDPSAWPDRFPTEAAVEAERARLHKVIADLVPWEASNNDAILQAARHEIARSVAWGLGEEPPPAEDMAATLRYLQEKAPPVYDPFSGGGSIPLEAQRLGLRAHGSDLNPVAVLIGKALVEIPPRFAGRPPVNPVARAALPAGGWRGAAGLAEDVRHYGAWMREEAARRVGHLYPKMQSPAGGEATVIAWIWARTVRSPDPAAKGAMVPLVSSFLLSTKEGRKAWVESIIDPAVSNGYRFEVRTGVLSTTDEERLKRGTRSGSGGFTCILTGSFISENYCRSEGKRRSMSTRMIAVVGEGSRERLYVAPSRNHEQLAELAQPTWEPQGELYSKALGFRVPNYGLTRWADLFSPRQTVALTTFSDLVVEVREKVLRECLDDGLEEQDSHAYANAVSTYLGLNVGKQADYSSNLCTWRSDPKNLGVGHVFSRQTLQMVWDYCESNPFSNSSGSWSQGLSWITSVLASARQHSRAEVKMLDARKVDTEIASAIFSTDPPYYDNIGYADLSDFFYVWLKPSLSKIYPDLFRRLSTPKDDELVATPERHGGVVAAYKFFMSGMAEAFSAAQKSMYDDQPFTLFYAFKQAQDAQDGITSVGWSSFLQGLVNAGFVIGGTWPVRTELGNRTRSLASNALASSVVLVCRKRVVDAGVITRTEFVRTLRRELPDAVINIRRAGVGPVDMQQSVIGPGMSVFTRHTRVLEDDDSPMTVRTALSLINRAWDEIENEATEALDAPTQVALAWFAAYGFDARPAGDLITLANAKNVSTAALFASGVFYDGRGKTALLPREQLPAGWTPTGDKTATVWECVQHTIRVLNAMDGGAEAAAALVATMGPLAEPARALAYRLFQIATERGWATEALAYNALAEEWPRLEDMAPAVAARQPVAAAQPSFL